MLRVNAVERHLDVAPWTTLLDALREHLDLTATKKGCDHGQCGACRVLDVIFVEERDSIVNPLGAKGLGDPGVVSVATEIGSAVFHATGHRVRELPITLDKLSGAVVSEIEVQKPSA